MKDVVVVTGATGNVGRALVDVLVREGRCVRALVRDPSRADFPAGVDVVRFDFGDERTFGAAFRHARSVFLVRPPAVARVGRDMAPAIHAAARGGAHTVTLSVMGAGGNPLVPHFWMERLVERAGAPFTHLRPSFFMQNLSTTYRDDIRRGELFVPAGAHATSFIDVRDVAAAAARVLGDPAHFGRSYTLTGGSALTYGEAARVLTRVLGWRVSYANPSPGAFRDRLLAAGCDPAYVRVLRGIYFVARRGLAARVTGELATLLGRTPTDFETFVREHADAWQTTGEPALPAGSFA